MVLEGEAMIKSFMFILTIVFSLTNCTRSEKEEDPEPSRSIKYTCENGQKLHINYFTTQKDTLYVKMTVEGIEYDLKRVRSASGEKYSNGKQTWWTKGASGFFQSDDIILIRECNSQANTEYGS